MAKYTYYTKEGLEKLKNTLTKFKTKGRAEIANQIAEARDKGDLSENAEYDAAKDAQGQLEARIAQLEGSLGRARLIDESKLQASSAGILSKITIKNKQTSTLHTYQLVSEEESNVKKGKISTESPIGKSLLGKEQGDNISVETPAGKVEFEIVKIEL